MSDKEIKKLKNKLKETEKQAEEYLNGWKRTKADYLNREREIAEEKVRWIKFANSELILKLLLILDSFEQSLNQLPKDLKDNQWAKGIIRIKQQFENFLCQQGVEKIKTVGEKFNPELHEAVEKKVKEEGRLENVIIKEIQTGYKMRNQVIKPAKVIIK